MDKKVIGITGGAGSGKSEVLRLMKEKYQAEIILSDDVARQLQEKGHESYNKMLDVFGTDILLDDGSIDRKKLADIVFSDKASLEQLNAIVHPDVRREIERRIQVSPCPVVLIESALLIECGYRNLCDEFWYVHTTEELRRKRMKDTRNYSDAKIDSIIKNQLPESEFFLHCDKVIENNSDLISLEKEIDKAMS